MPEIVYSYAGVPAIREFSRSNAFMRGLMGPFGSGKSSGCAVEIVRRGQAQAPGPDGVRRTRWAIIRNTYPQLRDTTIKTFHHWFAPKYFGKWKATDHDYDITAFEGSHIEILFRALDRPDHVANLLSLELTWAWVNEAREVPWPVIEALQGRVGRYPPMSSGGPTWYGIWMDTNPPDLDSWWHRIFEKESADNRVLFRQPGGRSPTAENLSNLPLGYYNTLAEGMDSDKRKVYVDGEYGFVIDGKVVYPDYIDLMHCAPLEAVNDVPIYRGWDFGLTPACAFVQVLPTGHINVVDECIATNLDLVSGASYPDRAALMPEIVYSYAGVPTIREFSRSNAFMRGL